MVKEFDLELIGKTIINQSEKSLFSKDQLRVIALETIYNTIIISTDHVYLILV